MWKAMIFLRHCKLSWCSRTEWKTCFSAGEQEDRDQRGGEAQRYVQRQEREREEKGVGVGRAGPGPRRIQQEARSCPWAALVVPCYSEVGSVFQSVSRDPPARPLRPLAVTLDEGFPHCSISGIGLCSSPRLSSRPHNSFQCDHPELLLEDSHTFLCVWKMADTKCPTGNRVQGVALTAVQLEFVKTRTTHWVKI